MSDFDFSPQPQPHRALYFATALGLSSSELVKAYILGCREKALLEGNTAADVEHTGPQFAVAVKELLCVSIWLTLLEQEGGLVPDWLKSFALEAMANADRLYAEPPAKRVMESYDIAAGADLLYDAASITLCTHLGLGSSSQDALIYLAHLLRQAKPNRTLLLATALRAPLNELDAKIAAM